MVKSKIPKLNHPTSAKIFDGQRYRFSSSWKEEINALNHAKALREEGYKVRTIPIDIKGMGIIFVNYKHR